MSDLLAKRSNSGSITFQNLFASIYRVVGIDPTSTLRDFDGRPQYLLVDPQPIRELLA